MGNSVYTFHSSGLQLIPTCTEEIVLIAFHDDVPLLKLGSLSLPISIVQSVSSTKSLRCIYFLFGLYNHPKTTLSYIGRTENLRDRLYQYPHKEARIVGYIETKLSKKDMVWIEDYLIYCLNPFWNSRYNITTNWQCCILKPPTLEFLQGFASLSC